MENKTKLKLPAAPTAGFPLRFDKLQGILPRKELCLFFDSLADPAAPAAGSALRFDKLRGMSSQLRSKPNPELRLMDQVRQVLRYHQYSYRTEQTYCDWIIRFVKYHGSQKHPKDMGNIGGHRR